jgi:hypothetical protein
MSSEFHYEMRLFHFLASEEHKEDIHASSVVKQSPPHFTYSLSVVNHTLPPFTTLLKQMKNVIETSLAL